MRRNLYVLILLAIVGWGCTPVRYRESADRETYKIIGDKQQTVFGEAETGFTIEKQPLPEYLRGTEGTTEKQPTGEAAGPIKLELSEETIQRLTERPKDNELEVLKTLATQPLTDARVATLNDRELTVLLKLRNEELAQLAIPTPPNATKLTLAQALEVSVANSRLFQDQKERLFLSGLSLTLQRHLWTPQLGLTGSAGVGKDGAERSINADSKFSVGQLLASGANVALNLGTNVLEFFTGDKRRAAASVLSLSFTQPLLRGGGRLVAMENLTQAERTVVYDVRSYMRFKRQFSVDVAQSYYRTLQARDTLVNNLRIYMSLRRDVIERNEMLKVERAGVRSLDVDEVKQDELAASDDLIFARQDYLDALDAFKISPLGLPTETPIVLDEKELESLEKKAAAGLPPPEVKVEEAVERALTNRLDVMTAQDQLEDAERAVLIARDALRAGLDFSISTSTNTEAPTKALKFQFDEGSYTASILADLPIDRKQERNAYRQALISLESEKRAFSLMRDNVKLEVRRAYRSLERAGSTVEIQRMGVELARKRVDNTKMSLEAGVAVSRDVLLATRSLLDTQLALTQALVTYEIAKLQLWLSIEEFHVDEKGMWAEESLSAEDEKNGDTADTAKTEEKPVAQS
ncbi:MAG: TolC family protein [bacterium]|nr:TolC family protein [bacterium]